jgi:hypothetical protein
MDCRVHKRAFPAADAAAVVKQMLGKVTELVTSLSFPNAALQPPSQQCDPRDYVSALLHAVQSVSLTRVRLLRALDMAVDKPAGRDTSPLFQAVKLGHVAIVQELVLDYTPFLNVPNDDGLTLLELAVQTDIVDMARVLLLAGANVQPLVCMLQCSQQMTQLLVEAARVSVLVPRSPEINVLSHMHRQAANRAAHMDSNRCNEPVFQFSLTRPTRVSDIALPRPFTLIFGALRVRSTAGEVTLRPGKYDGFYA